MPVKAVYNSLCLSIYITRHELEALMHDGTVTAPIKIGGKTQEHVQVQVKLNSTAVTAVQGIYREEKAAIEMGKAAWKAGRLLQVKEDTDNDR